MSAEIAAWIHDRRGDVIGLLQDLIRARSENPPGDESRVAAIVAGRLRALGAEVELLEPAPRRVNVIGFLDSGRPGPSLLCDAHLDTVPAGEGWSVDPFSAEMREGCIYGRGATDHKSPIAALLCAVDCLRSVGGLRGRLWLVFDADEEQGGALGMHSILPRVSPDVDAALYACATSYPPEGARFFGIGVDNIFNASVGLLRLRIGYRSEVRYQVAPVAWWYPAELAARSAARLPGTLRRPRWFGPAPRARLRSAAGDEQAWDVFVLPGESAAEVERRVSEAVTGQARRMGGRAEVEVLDSMEPAFCQRDHPLIRALSRGARLATGRRPRVTPVAAVTGMSVIQRRLGVPVAAFGYGRVDLDHAPDERISVGDLLASSIAYAESLAAL